MDYRIEEKPGFTILGKGIRVSMAEGGNLSDIPKFWADTPHDEPLYSMQKPDGIIGKAVLGVCADFDEASSSFLYLIAVEADATTDPGAYDMREIPAAAWAVFVSAGKLPEAIQTVWQRIFSEFFPTSSYVHAPGLPEIEMYPPGNVSSDDYVCEVWIPVVKKPV